jgi:hypothetical protein
MTLARRRQMARLERLAAPRIEQIRLAKAQREQESATRMYNDARVHAANLSLIILFGDPRIEEPLASAWEKCCKSASPELCDDASRKNMLQSNARPFDRLGAHWNSDFFWKYVLPRLPGTDLREKFAPIFAAAPLWLLWFTWADATMEVLDLPPRDHSAIWKFRRSKDDFFRWPVLPPGKFENIQMSDIEIAERRRKAEEAYALWDHLADEIGPRCGLLELKYRYPERFVIAN